MDDPFERGWLLYNQNRPELAEREVRERIGEHPELAEGYLLLGRCLGAQKQPAEAEEAVRRGLELEPDNPLCHFMLADTLFSRDKLDEAERAIDTALAARWSSPSYHAVKSAIRAARHDWRGMLEAADRGLEADPDHIDCLNQRALALTKLGRHDESAATLGETLARDPEDPHTHANQGWMLLHAGDAAQAAVHFEEALRLDPGLSFAREGLLEALRSRNRFYRNTLRLFLWTTKFKPWMVAVAFVGLFIAVKFGEAALNSWTGKRWPGLLVALLVTIFCFSLRFGQHFGNALLTFHPLGRRALPLSERALSAFVCAILFVALFCAGAFIWWTTSFWLTLGTTALLTALLASMDHPPQDKSSAGIREVVVAASLAIGGWFSWQSYQLWLAQREVLLAVAARMKADFSEEDIARAMKLPLAERQKIGFGMIKDFVEKTKEAIEPFDARRKELAVYFRYYLIAGFLIFLLGNPLETKKEQE